MSHVPQTGQTTPYLAGDDGNLQRGLPWPNPRFTDNEDGTVTDNLTELIWLKDASRFGTRTWSQALDDCNTLAADGGDLKDGSVPGDWRLPNVRELNSLIHYGVQGPALPNTAGTGKWSEDIGPFTGVQFVQCYYWSSTTFASNTHYALLVSMHNGFVNQGNKEHTNYVWPVRGGSW